MQPALELLNLVLERIWQDRINLAIGALRGEAVVVVEGVGHKLAAQRQDKRLVGGKTNWRQEIALGKGVAPSSCYRDWDTSCAQGLDITVDRALADLKQRRQSVGTAAAAPMSLQLKHNRQETIGTV